MNHTIKLLPLTAEQIELFINNPQQLFNSLALKPTCIEVVSTYIDWIAELMDALQNHILPMVKQDTENYQLHTHWLIIDEAENTCVGGIGGFVQHDEPGTSMIGYYIFNGFEGKGYATAAVQLFSTWLFQHGVQTVKAHTPIDHDASARVLQKSGFIRTGEKDNEVIWMLHSDKI